MYMAFCDIEDGQDPEMDFVERVCALRSGLYLIDTEMTQSKLYHAIKRKLPKDTALVVAELAHAPKFKGMSAGALKWVRASAIPED